MIHSYSSIYNLGHAAIADLLKGPVIVEEKIDGSQFSFGKNESGELSCRSKGAKLNLEAPEALFEKAVATVKLLAPILRTGYTYRGEYLKKPKHNTLAYDRVPTNHIIIFDIDTGEQSYLSPEMKRQLALELGMETVKCLHQGMVETHEFFRSLLDNESVFGGQKIEGVVIKPMNYDLYGRDKKVLFGKFVSEAFKEVHSQTWNLEHKNPTQGDILIHLGNQYRNAARWNKALIHLKEKGVIVNELKDIGALMKEVPEDVARECEAEIKQALWDWAWPQLRRGLASGLPDWYKDELCKRQFENK